MTKNLFTPQSIRTVSGQYVNVFTPEPATIRIEDIAHALSQQCRFGGHLPFMYSVAQHSVLCSYYIADDQYQFDALMHDAAEAYLIDLPRPIKKEIPRYNKIEAELLLVLSHKFGFRYPLPDPVKKVDMKMLKLEWQQLMISGSKSDPAGIIVQDAAQAKEKFLQRFNELRP